MKFVILDSRSITDKIKAGQEPVRFNESQSILRVNDKNADLLVNYKKYTDDEILTLDRNVLAESLRPVVSTSNPLPFASKVLENGKRLFQRVEGKEFQVTVSETPKVLDFQVPYSVVKFNEIEIIGAEAGDKIKLNILDDDNGTITGVPKFNLNTFGGKTSLVNLAPGFYKRKSAYDADLNGNMYISIEYETVSDKTVYVNYILHEIV